MAPLFWIRVGLAALFGIGAAWNVCLSIIRRSGPTERTGCLLAGGCLFTAAMALGLSPAAIRWPAGLVSAGLGIAWLRHIYRQSLHNTTM